MSNGKLKNTKAGIHIWQEQKEEDMDDEFRVGDSKVKQSAKYLQTEMMTGNIKCICWTVGVFFSP